MKKALLALVLPALVLAPGASAGHGNNADAHWNRDTVRLLDSVTADWDAALDAASTSWNAGLTEIDTTVEPSKSGARFRKKCPYADNAVRVCNASYGNRKRWKGTAGLAQYFFSIPGKHITKARIRLNDTNTSEAHRTAVTTHEVGHTLGLSHRPAGDTTSCMTPSVLPAQISPDTHDFEEVDDLHGHNHAMAAHTADGQPDRNDPHVSYRRVSDDEILVTWRIAVR